MRAATRSVLFLFFLQPLGSIAQVNITPVHPQAQPPQTQPQPCKSQIEMLPDGKLKVTDCSGKTLVSDPSAASSEKQEGLKQTAPNSAFGTVTVSPKLASAYEDFQIASLQYEKQQLARNQTVFAWQDFSSKVMFWIVSVIVFTGLVLSALQFRKAQQIDLSAGKDGLHLRTTIVGIVILAMSMVFLYLYLFFVYPIKEIGR